MQICLALKHIHNLKIIHRNIKPSNIFLMKQNTDNFAKLGDFGLAKELNQSFPYTKTNVATPQYADPEILKGEKYSFKSDIWSLGVTFYQLIIFDFPFEGKTIAEMQTNILEGKIKKIPENYKIDHEFLELINKMLSFKEDERPSAQEIIKKAIINTRMKCYLKENGFDLKQSNLLLMNMKKMLIVNIKKK